jgi:hypothetical protein
MNKCMNPNGTSTCVNNGGTLSCSPSCAAGYSACGPPESGCSTPTGADPDKCGGCSRTCSNNHVVSRACTSSVCTPTCAAPYSDCSRPAAPLSDDGCETNGTLDPGEPDNQCTQPELLVDEGNQVTAQGRILPATDVDTYTFHLVEGDHFCFPGAGQSYQALVVLTAPEAMSYRLNYNLNACDNSWQAMGPSLCVNWSGTCGSTDDVTLYFQVAGNSGANSCQNYQLTVQYCSGGHCAGCP